MFSTTFNNGGIYNISNKRILFKERNIIKLLPKQNLIFPLLQHIGKPAIPIVNIGDYVLVGQKIAKINDNISANIHSSVSGTVIAIKIIKIYDNIYTKAIIIENDNKYIKIKMNKINNIKFISKINIIKKIKDAGIVGLGGAGFPTHIKLSPPEPNKIKYILINAIECEPYIVTDYYIILKKTKKIIYSIKCILKLFNNAIAYICIDNDKIDCIYKIFKLIKNETRIKIKILQTKYPQGFERYLINTIINKKNINSKEIMPFNLGCIVLNISTIYSIYMSIFNGYPLIEKNITIMYNNKIKNYKVKIGMNISEIINLIKHYINSPIKKIIIGGPMMGTSVYNYYFPIIKTTSSILCITNNEKMFKNYNELNCINCGRCISICPEKLIPSCLFKYSIFMKIKKFIQLKGMNCINCGCCSFICPARKHLTQAIYFMKKNINNKLENK